MGRLLGALALVGLCLVATASVVSAQNITVQEVTSVGGCNNGQPGILPPGVPDCNLRMALGSNQSVTYSFTIANSSVGNMSVVAVARVLNGLVNMVLYMPGSSPSGLPDDTSKTLYQNLASSEKFIYMPAKRLLPGRYFIKINSYSGNPTLTLSIFTPSSQTRLAAPELAALKEIQSQCCKSNGLQQSNASLQAQFDACNTGFPMATKNNHTYEEDFCHQAPNVCDATGRLTRLIIPFGGLTCPSFPAAMAKFTNLRTLDLTMNVINDNMDNVVKVLKQLPNLEHVYMRFLGVGGKLSCDVALPGLKTIALTGNKLEGPIPECLLQSETLSELYLSRNKLSGGLPTFPQTSALTVFYAMAQEGEGLTGPIPASLASCQNLLHLDISRNKLSGSIPALPPALLYLNVSDNQLEGRLPALPAFVVYMDVNTNKLSGPIQDLAPLSQLYYLDMSYNRFEGSLPSLPASLSVVDFSSNKLSGALPDMPAALRWFGAADNQLSGGIDKLNLAFIFYAYLANNKLTGDLPSSIYKSAFLSELDLSNNQLSGSIQNSFKSPALTMLDLSNNRLSGPVPATLATLTSLTHLDLASNELSGELVAFTASLNNAFNSFAHINMSSNKLTGPVPSGLQNLALFDKTNPLLDPYTGVAQDRVFDISFNAFTGKFPVYVFKYLPDVTERCGCVVAVNISGPDMRLECPTDQNATFKASTLSASKLECIGTDGGVKDFANFLVTGQLNAPAGSSRGPNAGLIAGAVIGALVGLALLAGAGYLAYKRYSEHSRATGFESMKDEMASTAVENPLEQQAPQV